MPRFDTGERAQNDRSLCGTVHLRQVRTIGGFKALSFGQAFFLVMVFAMPCGFPQPSFFFPPALLDEVKQAGRQRHSCEFRDHLHWTNPQLISDITEHDPTRLEVGTKVRGFELQLLWASAACPLSFRLGGNYGQARANMRLFC